MNFLSPSSWSIRTHDNDDTDQNRAQHCPGPTQPKRSPPLETGLSRTECLSDLCNIVSAFRVRSIYILCRASIHGYAFSAAQIGLRECISGRFRSENGTTNIVVIVIVQHKSNTLCELWSAERLWPTRLPFLTSWTISCHHHLCSYTQKARGKVNPKSPANLFQLLLLRCQQANAENFVVYSDTFSNYVHLRSTLARW